MTELIVTYYNKLYDAIINFIELMAEVTEIITSPLNVAIPMILNPFQGNVIFDFIFEVIEQVLYFFGFGTLSILDIVVGGGISIIIIVAIVKFFIDLFKR